MAAAQDEESWKDHCCHPYNNKTCRTIKRQSKQQKQTQNTDIKLSGNLE